MKAQVGIGVIGAGGIAQISHIPYLLDDDERFRLVAVADRDEALLADVCRRHGIENCHRDAEALLARDDIEAVIICHSGSHYKSVMSALEAGKDVLVEKPLAWNLRECQEIALRAADGEQIIQLGYHKLHDPAYPVAKQYVDSMEELGYVRISLFHPAAQLGYAHHRIRRGAGRTEEGYAYPGSWDEQLLSSLKGLASGELGELVDEALGEKRENDDLRRFFGLLNGSLIHNIYMMFAFLGAPARILHVELWRNALSFHILLEYSPGLCCTLEWHHLPYLSDYRESYEFYGNRSRVHLHFPSPYLLHAPTTVVVQDGDAERVEERRIVASYDEAYRRELRDFHSNIVQRTQPASGVAEAVAHARFIQELVEAV